MSIFEPGFLRACWCTGVRGKLPPGTMLRFYFGGREAEADGGFTFGLAPTERALDAYLELLGDCPLPWSVTVVGGDLFATDLPRARARARRSSAASASRTTGAGERSNEELVASRPSPRVGVHPAATVADCASRGPPSSGLKRRRSRTAGAAGSHRYTVRAHRTPGGDRHARRRHDPGQHRRPRRRAARHVRAPRARRSTSDQAPRRRRRTTTASSSGCSRARQVGSMGLNAVVTWPKEEWGIDPTSFAEMRPGAYDVHERVRDMNRNGILASMCFPTFAGLQRPARSSEADDKDLALRDAPGLQRLAHRRVVRRLSRAASSRSRSPPIWDPQGWWPRVRRVAAKGCTRDHDARAPAHRRASRATTTSTTGARSSRRVSDEQVVMCLHIGQGFAAINTRARRADRQPDHPRHAGLGVRRAGPAVGSGVPHLPRPQGRVVGSRHRVDPLLPRPLRPSLRQPAVAGSRLRRQDAERHLPRALARVLRHRPGRR